MKKLYIISNYDSFYIPVYNDKFINKYSTTDNELYLYKLEAILGFYQEISNIDVKIFEVSLNKTNNKKLVYNKFGSYYRIKESCVEKSISYNKIINCEDIEKFKILL